jgi:hypothetical protein
MSSDWSFMKFLEDFIDIFFFQASKENYVTVPYEKDTVD